MKSRQPTSKADAKGTRVDATPDQQPAGACRGCSAHHRRGVAGTADPERHHFSSPAELLPRGLRRREDASHVRDSAINCRRRARARGDANATSPPKSLRQHKKGGHNTRHRRHHRQLSPQATRTPVPGLTAQLAWRGFDTEAPAAAAGAQHNCQLPLPANGDDDGPPSHRSCRHY